MIICVLPMPMAWTMFILFEAVLIFPFPFDFLLMKIRKIHIFPNCLRPFEAVLGPLVLVRCPDMDILASERLRVTVVCVRKCSAEQQDSESEYSLMLFQPSCKFTSIKCFGSPSW